MKILASLFSIILSLLLLAACSAEPKISVPKEIKFIGHKGSGTINENGNIELQENTWESIANAMNSIDGSEIDLQLSADSTLWLFHDHKILNCQDSLINLFLCSDEELLKISECNYDSNLLSMSTFLTKVKTQNWEGKIICLDLKLLYNPAMDQSQESQQMLLSFTGNKLLNTFKSSPFEVLIEVFEENQHTFFDNIFPGNTFLVNYSPTKNFIHEMKEKNRRLSLPLYELNKEKQNTDAQIDNIWTINTANEFFKGLKLDPKVMQSDNIPMMQFFKSIQEGKALSNTVVLDSFVKTKEEEFNHLLELKLPLENNQLLHFETFKRDFPEEVFLVYKGFNERDSSVYWQGVELAKNANPFLFLDSDFMKHKNASKIHINIWNKSRSNLNHKYKIRLLTIQQD